MKRKAHTRPAAVTDATPTRDANALVNDEYSDPTFIDPDRGDALDETRLLDDESALDEVPSGSDGVQPVPQTSNDQFADALPTSDDGHVVHRDQSETGLGAELSSVDDLARATIGAPRTHHRHRQQ